MGESSLRLGDGVRSHASGTCLGTVSHPHGAQNLEDCVRRTDIDVNPKYFHQDPWSSGHLHAGLNCGQASQLRHVHRLADALLHLGHPHNFSVSPCQGLVGWPCRCMHAFRRAYSSRWSHVAGYRDYNASRALALWEPNC